MNCPNCGNPVPENSAECPRCSVIFAKWKPREQRPVPVAPGPVWTPYIAAWRGSPYFFPSLAATVAALVYGWHFSSFLPITEGWESFCHVLFPLAAIDLAIHEAGHVIFGVLGNRFLMVAGGTAMQLLLPAAFFIHFLRRANRCGMAFCAFWFGLNLAEISWYAADASIQALVLITGMSGAEGGGHDWHYMLGELGLLKNCVGVGRLFFISGIWLMVFAPAALAAKAISDRRKSANVI